MVRAYGGLHIGLDGGVAATDAVLRAFAEVACTAQLAKVMDGISNELGFRHYALIHHDDLRGDPPHRVKLLDYPQEVENRIIGQAMWRRDPVIRACCFTPQAFRWSDLPGILILNRKDKACLDFGARSGLDEGITVPFHLLGECMGSCTFTGAIMAAQVRRVLGMAQMIGIFAFQAARRILLGTQVRPISEPRLQPRHRDCIVLVGRGYSNKEIARALSLTPRTVDGYLTEARELFGAHSRAELVCSALFAGEVGLHEMERRQSG